jgi:hypothetical protein
MPVFTIGVPHETEEPRVEVLFTEESQQSLAPGKHTFRLVVWDNDNLDSRPAYHEVIVKDDRMPTAVVDGPDSVPYGRNFELYGDRSTDPSPGRVVRYVWTQMD